MGQRFQFYVKTRKGWVSAHDQWCYGQSPIVRLKVLLEYNKNCSKGYKFGGTMEHVYDTQHRDTVCSLLSVNAQYGYQGKVYDLHEGTGEKPDPSTGHNNDGILALDFTNASSKRPKYAFVNIDHLEGTYGSSVPKFIPLTATRYLEAYYSNTTREFKQMGSIIKYVDRNADVLTIEELAGLFPDTYKEFSAERNTILGLSLVKLLPLVMSDELVYDANKILAEKRIKEGV